MGWFWADAPPAAKPDPHRSARPHGRNMTGAPPPGCPMHSSSKPAAPATADDSAAAAAAAAVAPAAPPPPPAPTKSWSSRLNPLNMMPTLSQERQPEQKSILSTSRSTSTIPKGSASDEGNWEYPSPQQMYNALLRKGYTDTPEDAMESMVEVHNFLNEGAWQEIEGWERQFGGGVIRGWKIASSGGKFEEVERESPVVSSPPRLLRFMGRPSEPTPKARMLNMLGRVYPSKFGGPLPFDRHDWFILRQPSFDPSGAGGKPEPVEVRYVIDYYEGPPEPTGEPVFYLDVRPALDRPTAAVERAVRWGGDIWWRASGAVVREEKRRKEAEERQFGGF